MSLKPDDYRKRIKKGEVLLKEGEEGQEFYLLEEGVLNVFIHEKKVATINARDSQEFVGEVAALLGGPRVATVVADTDCVALCLPKLQFEAILRNSPSLGAKLIRSICRKLSSLARLCGEYHEHSASVFQTGSTEASLRNYMKGLLFLMDYAATNNSADASKRVCDYFRKTNPWRIQTGDEKLVIDPAAQNPLSS